MLAPCGTFISSTMMVMMVASTPSLNAANRPEGMTPPRADQRIRGSDAIEPDRTRCWCYTLPLPGNLACHESVFRAINSNSDFCGVQVRLSILAGELGRAD